MEKQARGATKQVDRYIQVMMEKKVDILAANIKRALTTSSNNIKPDGTPGSRKLAA